MKIRPFQISDEQDLIRLIGEFRVSQAELHGKARPIDLPSARKELVEYSEKGFPIFVAEDDPNLLAGYMVCRVDGDVVWVEALYVMSEYRRQGIASSLFLEAERLTHELGGDFPYNWVDPRNDKIIRFLQKRGYNTLNLIELRRPYSGEEAIQKIPVGSYEFDL